MAALVELIVDKLRRLAEGRARDRAQHGALTSSASGASAATELMWRVKRLADPDGVLSPGVVLNRDPGVHLRNLKTTPPIEESATRCVECGFCEPVCPSRDLTTTPRQRIVLRREIARQPAGSPVQQALLEEYGYDGARHLRRRRHLPARLPGRDRHRDAGQGTARPSATRAAPSGRRWRRRSAGGRSSRPRGRRCGSAAAAAAADAQRAGAAGPGGRAMPAARRPARAPRRLRPLPAPTGSSAGGAGRGAGRGLGAGGRRSGSRPTWRAAAAGCRGARKGYADARTATRPNELVERLWEWSDEGALPIVIDAASCTGSVVEPGEGTLREANAERLAALTVLDAVAWAHDRLLPGLEVTRRLDAAAIHPTCATHRQGHAARLGALAAAIADDVYLPPTGDLLRLRRRPRHLPPRADRVRDPRRGRARWRRRPGRPPLRRLPVVQPHLRDRHDPRHRPRVRVRDQRPRARHPLMLMGRKPRATQQCAVFGPSTAGPVTGFSRRR